MNSATPPADSAAFCADLVRSHDFPRYVATLFVPAAERRALLALYAFNVEIVRVRDQVSQPLPGEIRLQWWTDMLSGHAHGIGVVQRDDDPRVLFPELLVKATTSYPGLFWNGRDLIWGKDLRLLWGNPCKLLADGRIEFDLVWLKLWAVVKGGMLLVDGLTTNLRE